MNCEQANELIPLYLDQALDDAQSKALRKHLLGCKACKNELIEMEEVLSKLKQMPMLALPEGYHEEVMEKIRTSSTVVPLKNKKRGGAAWKSIGAAAAVFAIVVVAGGGLNGMLKFKDESSFNTNVLNTTDVDLKNNEPEAATDEPLMAASELPEEQVDAGFENMEDVMVLEPAEQDAALGGLPGNVVSAIVPSNEEIIIIDDLGLLEPTAPVQVNQTPQPEVVVAEIPSTEILASEPVLPIQNDMVTERSAIISPEINDSEIDWEPIPEVITEPLLNESVTAIPIETSEEAVNEIQAAPQTSSEVPTEILSETPSAVPSEIPFTGISQQLIEVPTLYKGEILPKSDVVQVTISAADMQTVLQAVSKYVEDQGGMVLREALKTAIDEPSVPENRILFKVPKAVYDVTMAEIAKLGVLGDTTNTKASLDGAYEVLLKERLILSKNGYNDLQEELAEYERKIQSWEQEQDYTAVYLTVLEDEK